MGILIIDGAAFQRTILTMLLEAEGREDVADYASVDDLPSPPAPDDILFIDVTQYARLPNVRSENIVVTAPDRGDSRLADAVSSGANAFLPKPFTPEGLRIALRDLALWKGFTS